MAYWLIKTINQAIREHAMIADGDRVAVAVSGGKDSLALLRLLDLRRRSVPEHYELVAVHVLGDARGAIEPHDPLQAYLAETGLPYHCVPLELDPAETVPMNCQRCTWNRRRTLFAAAHRLGCNVVAMGHHADDLAQTTLLNLLYHGRVETMAPRRNYFEGQIRLIRPLCYTAESDLRRFARAMNFPPPPPLCPQADHSRRELARRLVAQAQPECPAARTNLLRAGLKGLQLLGDEYR